MASLAKSSTSATKPGLTSHPFRRRGWRRWPGWLLAVLTAAAILMRIGFWLTFFHGGGAGLGLGIVRSMFESLIEIIAATIPPALVVIWLLLIVRISKWGRPQMGALPALGDADLQHRINDSRAAIAVLWRQGGPI